MYVKICGSLSCRRLSITAEPVQGFGPAPGLPKTGSAEEPLTRPGDARAKPGLRSGLSLTPFELRFFRAVRADAAGSRHRPLRKRGTARRSGF